MTTFTNGMEQRKKEGRKMRRQRRPLIMRRMDGEELPISQSEQDGRWGRWGRWGR
jgi:hypothetical protein